MSQFDQAFAKIYGTASLSPRRPAARPATAGAPPTGAAGGDSAERTIYFDGPHAGPGGPHGRAAVVPPATASAAAAAAPPEPTSPPLADAAADPALTAAEPLSLRASFEVQSLVWPRVVELLVAAAGHEFSELARSLGERARAGRRLLAVTGCLRGEGRTSLVLALGRLLAMRGLRVALVDADFRHPHLARQVGLSVESGLEAVLAGEAPLADALVESLDDRLTLLPLQGLVADTRLLVGNRALVESLEALRAAFDLVIVDAGPVSDDAAAVDLAASLGRAAIDDALVVRDVRRTHGGMIPAIARRLAAAGVTCWEAVETFVPLEPRP